LCLPSDLGLNLSTEAAGAVEVGDVGEVGVVGVDEPSVGVPADVGAW
jgi:hypothetical protein